MNLHINKEKFNQLMEAPRVGIFDIGSILYGLNDETSDTDKLVIYYPFRNQICNPFMNHHQFQYKDKENNTDYNFTDVVGFIRNLTSGDSTVNFEVLHSGQLEDTDLAWLVGEKEYFNTYAIARSYLGMAKRDAEQFYRRKTDKDKLAGCLHVARGYKFAQGIINDSFKLIEPQLIELKKSFSGKDDHRNFISVMLDVIKASRSKLNTHLQNGRITRYLDPGEQQEINFNLIEGFDMFQNKDYIDLMDIYEANEKPELKYE